MAGTPVAPGGSRPVSTLSRESWLAAALIAVGIAIRVLDSLPDHRFPDEADCSLTGIAALKILGGHLRVFYSGVRLGAFESYLNAGWFALFGVSHGGLSAGPIFGSALTLLFFWLFAREVLGPRMALLALLFLAIPTPAYDFWTSLPVSYGQTMMFSSAVLWLSARIARGRGELWPAFGLGLAAGLGFWNCFLTLAVTLPAFAWVALRSPAARRARFVGLVACGFVLGALPWIAFNVRYPLASFHKNFAARPSKSFLSNARHFFRYDLAELTVASDPLDREAASSFPARIGKIALVGVYAAALLLFLRRSIQRHPRPTAELLLLLVLLTTAALNVLSEAGSQGGMTVRYVLPAYFAAVFALAHFCRWTWSKSRPAAVGVAALVLSFNLAGYFWPWSQDRREWRALHAGDQRRLAFLKAQRIDLVMGTYWDSYPLNFDSEMRIKGVPYQPLDDFYEIEATLGARPTRCAAVAANLDDLRRTVRRAGLPGRFFEVAPKSYVFLPEPNPCDDAPRDFIARMRLPGAPTRDRPED